LCRVSSDAEGAQEGAKCGLDRHGLPDLLFADPFPDFLRAQSFFVRRPVAAKLGDGFCALWRTALRASWKMAQEQRFVARILPKQLYPLGFGKSTHPGVAIRLLSEAIGIKKNGMLFVAAAAALSFLDSSFCSFDQSQWITARLQRNG
jgi:hypothetical protein